MITNTVWYFTGTISYTNNSWATFEVRHDDTGNFSSGPDVSKLPEVVNFYSKLGIDLSPAVPDASIREIVFRFSALTSNGTIDELGGTESDAELTVDNQTIIDEVKDVLLADEFFNEQFDSATELLTIFGADLFAQYDDSTMYQDQGKTIQATAPGQTIQVWADRQGHQDLSMTTIDLSVANGWGISTNVPQPAVNASLLNGHPVYGDGWVYSRVDGSPITQVGDSGLNGAQQGFWQSGFGNPATFTVFMVNQTQIRDAALIQFDNDSNTFNEYQILWSSDHHSDYGSILQNLVADVAYTDIKVQAYQGPDVPDDAPSTWHRDGVYRVVAVTFSWTRAKNALWVNGTKYPADGNPLIRQNDVDSGANADLLVPTANDFEMLIPNYSPCAFLGIVHGEQSDADILAGCRALGQRYNITVA